MATTAASAVLAVWLVGIMPTGCASSALQAVQVADKPPSRLRPADEKTRALLDEGLRRSATLSELAADIESSDLWVSLAFSKDPGIGRGVTHFSGTGGGFRIMSVKLNASLRGDERLAMLGHELQHVREVANAPEVTSPATMRRFFERVGTRDGPRGGFETAAAQLIERRVREELARNRENFP